MARERGGGRRALIVIVAMGVVIALAVTGPSFVQRRLALRRVDQHERTWRRERPEEYRYEIETVCFCKGPSSFAVEVAGGRVVAVDPEPDAADRPMRIEELFGVARRAIRDGADSVDVAYAADGHPTRLSIDYSKGTADDENTYIVRDLTPQPAGP